MISTEIVPLFLKKYLTLFQNSAMMYIEYDEAECRIFIRNAHQGAGMPGR
jgi:hypothetical protein